MGRLTMRNLREKGVSDCDLETARMLQKKQQYLGIPVQSLATICGILEPKKPSPVIGFTEKAMRKQGAYDQAALLLQQKALSESSPERAEEARKAAKIARNLSRSAQLEFDFFGGGNVSIAFQYQDAVTDALRSKSPSPARQDEALAVLWTICRHLGWQTYECTKTAADLCETTGKDKGQMARALDLLEQVGAIKRVKRGRAKVITVTPEGAFRGNINNHAKVVERYKLEVIDGGKNE